MRNPLVFIKRKALKMNYKKGWRFNEAPGTKGSSTEEYRKAMAYDRAAMAYDHATGLEAVHGRLCTPVP